MAFDQFVKRSTKIFRKAKELIIRKDFIDPWKMSKCVRKEKMDLVVIPES